MNDKPTNLQYCKETFLPGETNILYNKLEEGEKNLYIVSTPMQLLSAIEAQYYFQTKNNVLIILFFLIRDGKNINQMFNLLEHFPYCKLLTYQNSNNLKIFSLIKYIKEISSVDYNNVFFGYSTPIYRRMIANINYKKLFFLDDGVGTITTHNQIHNKKDLHSKLSSLITEKQNYKKRLRDIYYALNNIKIDCDLAEMNFFTMFDLPVFQNEQIINNNFSHTRELFLKDVEPDNTIYILGQPLKRAIKMHTFEYIRYLDKVFECYSDRKIVYIPHRVEPMSEWFQYILYKHKNLTILYLDMPVELFFLKNSIMPTKVISFMTTALFTIQKIFPQSSTQYIEIDTSLYTQYHQENIQLIYDNYKKNGIEKFNCNND